MRRRELTNDSLSRYALSLGFIGAALVLRYFLAPWLGDTLPFVTVFGAVAAAVWIGGVGPGIVVVVAGYIGSALVFSLAKPEPASLLDLGGVAGLLAYLFTCTLILAIGEAMQNARRRESQGRERLRVALRSIGDGVIMTDVDGRITSMNPVAESLTGWNLADAIGQPLDAIFRIINEDSRQPVANPATRALREGTVVGLANHTLLVRKDGRECPIDDSAAPITDDRGTISGSVLIFRDVTGQRERARDQALQLLASRRLAAIVESSDDAIITKSLTGTIQTWNAAAERIFGFAASEAVGEHISIVIPPERLDEEDRIIASLQTGTRIEHFETERMRADGSRIRVSLTISPLKDVDGRIIGASKIVRDVTERTRVEAERQKFADDLSHLAADLSEADRRKNEFLAMLAHELRNPLAPMSNAVRALQVSDGKDVDALRAAAAMLDRQVRQMSRLVDDLLDMSRISRGKIELRRQPIELAPVIHQALEAVRAQFVAMGHELTVTLPQHPIHLDADAARLAQVVGNLLNNACKFTDRGGHVWLTVSEEDSQAIVRVRDSGIGIAPEHLPGLFDMFAQVDTSLERSRDGLGIGLTLVKSIVELHGGSVDVRSDGAGRGSEFTVRLPIVKETAAAVSAAPVAAPVQQVPMRRVLIVDDSEDGAESLAMILQFSGHETHLAHDGLAAIAAAERLRPDAVLLDIGLPKLNGYEVCRRIRQEPWGKDMILVALTGWGQEEDRRRANDAGFDAHMVKPVDHDALVKLLAATPPTTASH